MIYRPADIEAHWAQLKEYESSTGTLAYLDMGEGHPIFLIHGIPTNSWLYRLIIPHLTQAGHRVIVPDMLGFGKSDKPDILSSYSPVMHSQRLLELKRHLQIDHYDLVVHDAGGPWSYNFVLETLTDLQHMVLLNTIMYAEGFNPPIRPKKDSLFSKILGELYDSRIFGKMMVNSTLRSGTDKHKMTRHEKRGYWHSIHPGSDAPIRYFFTHLDQMELSAQHFRERVTGNDVHMSIIWGKTDGFLLADEQVPLIQEHFSVPADRTHVLEDTSHFLTEEEPETVASLILQSIAT